MSKRSRRLRRKQRKALREATAQILTPKPRYVKNVGLVIFREDEAPEVIPQGNDLDDLIKPKDSSEFFRRLLEKRTSQDLTLLRRMTGFCVQFTEHGRIVTREIVYGLAYDIELAAGNGFSYLRFGGEDEL